VQTRRSFLKSSVAVPGLMAGASILSMFPTPARAQVIEGIGLLLSAYQAFGKKGGDGGLSAILKNTLEKLDQIHNGLNLLSEKLDAVIAIIAGSTDEIISQIQRSEMRAFTSSILTQVKRYEILQPRMETSGIEGIRTYNNGDEIRRIRDETYNSLLEMFSVERVSMVHPIDLITSMLGLGLFALADSIIDNDQSVRDRAISAVSDLILRAATLDGRNGSSIYIGKVESRIKTSADRIVKDRNWPEWAITGINKILEPKIEHADSITVNYAYIVPQAVWIAHRADYSQTKCETRTRSKGSSIAGFDYDEDYEYCFEEPRRMIRINGYSLVRKFSRPIDVTYPYDAISAFGKKIDPRQYAVPEFADLVMTNGVSLSTFKEFDEDFSSSPQQVGSDRETSAYLFQEVLVRSVAKPGDSVNGQSGFNWKPFTSEGAKRFAYINSDSTDWMTHSALLQTVVDALKMLNVTHSALVRET
jgi:hypothetical protein